MDDSDRKESPTHWIDMSIGRRYVGCTLDNFEVSSEEQSLALAVVRDYVHNFKTHFQSGRSLLLVGPKGTGKDHLMVAATKSITIGCRGSHLVYRDGLSLFAELRADFDAEDEIVKRYIRPHLLAISDPVPPRGTLSEYEQRMLYRIVDGRYREMRPTACTLNAATRAELDERLSPQCADRLFDGAIVAKCNWESYRTKFDGATSDQGSAGIPDSRSRRSGRPDHDSRPEDVSEKTGTKLQTDLHQD